jgi:RNA polymerase sigma-70 factor (ECF subfamily)
MIHVVSERLIVEEKFPTWTEPFHGLQALVRNEGRRSMNFEAFYRASYRRIYAAALTMAGDPEIALDGTQEAFVRAFARWRRLSKEPWVEGWVMSTAMNLCKRHLRRQRREMTGSELESGIVSHGSDEGHHLYLLSLLSTLPRRQREAMMLHYLADLPVAAVAHLMNISEGTVKSHLSQARSTLRARLEAEDVR